ncbi:flagellar assembly protein FliH [Bacillus sp. CECT 9360]|uniref:flagellar assembly protein FliH n=1 Tax=Bacillus sp. CECT 9360 TaxID=2845821 RepID=UPI001E5A48F6|nr:flagellar assembly protein FliH [Bacillus sp. CECT 9360]
MSRIIKSPNANAVENREKQIKIRSFDFLFKDAYPETNLVIHEIDTRKILDEAYSEAEAIIRDARQQAESILEQAKAAREHFEQVEKPQLIQEAREHGFNEGMEFGNQKGYDECAASIDHAKEIVIASKNDYQTNIEASEGTILELGIKVAEQIIGTKLQESEGVYLSIVRQAVKKTRDHRELQLHVNPIHYEYILTQKEELISLFPKETEFYIYPDQDLGENDCIIESTHGRIDAGVDSQLAEIKQKLFDLLEGE